MDNSKLADRIGYMQGRLSPQSTGVIQSFPWKNWRNEFVLAKEMNFKLMEWTLDQEHLSENPLMTEYGRTEIASLSKVNAIEIPSLTGDCFMQAPFWKSQGAERIKLEKIFSDVIKNCAATGIKIVVLPLVDNGRLESKHQEDNLIYFLETQINFLRRSKLRVAFESDYEPLELLRFIERLDSDIFGINYDIGNSAALGFDPAEELSFYSERIFNVHIKDRILGGTTVPLGLGSANFNVVFSELAKVRYQGNFILQTARDPCGNHAGVLGEYRNMTIDWLVDNGF